MLNTSARATQRDSLGSNWDSKAVSIETYLAENQWWDQKVNMQQQKSETNVQSEHLSDFIIVTLVTCIAT